MALDDLDLDEDGLEDEICPECGQEECECFIYDEDEETTG